MKQGDPLSPVLFNLTPDTALFHLEASPAGLLSSGDFNQLVYADDTILFATNLVNMQDKLNEFVFSLSKLGLEINPNKYRLLHLDGNRRKFSYVRTRSIVNINKIPVPVISTNDVFKYLGIEFSYRRIAQF